MGERKRQGDGFRGSNAFGRKIRQKSNAFGRKIRQKSALRSGILFASTEVMHRPKSDSSLHFDIRNI